jgi:hypothetical protein
VYAAQNINVLYTNQNKSGSFGSYGSRYCFGNTPTFLASNFAMTNTSPSWSLFNEMASPNDGGTGYFWNTCIFFNVKMGFVVGGYVSGQSSSEFSAYKINSDGTLNTTNVYWNIFSTDTAMPQLGPRYSSKGGRSMSENNYEQSQAFNNNYGGFKFSDGNFTIDLGLNMSVTRNSDGYSSSGYCLGMNAKATNVGTYQYVLYYESINSFDPHSLSYSVNNNRSLPCGEFSYIVFESSSYIYLINANPLNQACSWNGDTQNFVAPNTPISVSCKNLNFCGYINPAYLEPYTFSKIDSSTISNNQVTVSNQSVAIPMTSTNFTTYASTLHVCVNPNINTSYFLIAVPATRTVLAMTADWGYLWFGQTFGSDDNNLADFASGGNFITHYQNLAGAKFKWNNRI